MVRNVVFSIRPMLRICNYEMHIEVGGEGRAAGGEVLLIVAEKGCQIGCFGARPERKTAYYCRKSLRYGKVLVECDVSK